MTKTLTSKMQVEGSKRGTELLLQSIWKRSDWKQLHRAQFYAFYIGSFDDDDLFLQSINLYLTQCILTNVAIISIYRTGAGPLFSCNIGCDALHRKMFEWQALKVHSHLRYIRDCDCVNKVMGCTCTPVIGSIIRLRNGLCTQFSDFSCFLKHFRAAKIVQ